MRRAVADIVFTDADLRAFADASGDRNPLHCADDHARCTAFGEVVVHGMCAVGAMLGAARIAPLRSDGAISVEFPRAVSCHVPYRVEVDDEGVIQLFDGHDLAVRVAIERELTPRRAEVIVEEKPGAPPALAPRRAPLPRRTFATSDLHALRVRWGLDAGVVSDGLLRVLLHVSYVIGMEVPGTPALFAGGRIEFRRGGDAAMHVRDATVHAGAIDPRFDLQSVRVTFGAPEQPCATAALRAFVRRDPPALDVDELRARAAASAAPAAWTGRQVWVTGASRGLGAALAACAALRGADVIGIARHRTEDAERLADACAATPGSFRLLEGDVTDPAWWPAHAPTTLDALICAAGPALRPLSLHAACLERMHAHLSTAVACTLTPITACLPALEHAAGRCVLISSSAAHDAVAAWPHYVAAKRAAEGIVMTAAAAHPTVSFHVARPPRLQTTLTNVPMGHREASRVEPIAHEIVEALGRPAESNGVQWIDPRATITRRSSPGHRSAAPA